ncbi:MAG: hypothetical protein AB1427_17175 [Thermodesulfobacteriota bacterium]
MANSAANAFCEILSEAEKSISEMITQIEAVCDEVNELSGKYVEAHNKEADKKRHRDTALYMLKNIRRDLEPKDIPAAIQLLKKPVESVKAAA